MSGADTGVDTLQSAGAASPLGGLVTATDGLIAGILHAEALCSVGCSHCDAEDGCDHDQELRHDVSLYDAESKH